MSEATNSTARRIHEALGLAILMGGFAVLAFDGSPSWVAIPGIALLVLSGLHSMWRNSTFAPEQVRADCRTAHVPREAIIGFVIGAMLVAAAFLIWWLT